MYRQVSDIAAESSSTAEFWANAFREVASHTRSIYAQIALSSGATVIEDYWHQGPTDPGFWKPTVSAIIDETIGETGEKARVFQSRNEHRRVAILSTALVDSRQKPIGALGLVLEVSESDDIHSLLSELNALAHYLLMLARSMTGTTRSAPTQSQPQSGASLEKMSSVESLHELAFAVTNNLRNRLGCEQVGLAKVFDGNTRLLVVSGFDEIKESNPGISIIKAAMEEAVDRGQPIVYQSQGDWDSAADQPEYRLHRKWHEDSGGAAVASIPFMRDEDCLAVISLRAKPGVKWDAEMLSRIETQVMPYAIGLDLVESANRSVQSHAWLAAKSAAKSLAAPQSIQKRICVALLLLVAAWVAFGTATYRISVPCAVRPAVAQRYFAPFAGVVESVHVQAGDTVAKGQLLFQMSIKDVQLELDYLLAQTRISEIALQEAIKERDGVKAQVERGQLRLYDAQRAIALRQFQQSQMRAAYNGLVTIGDPNLINHQMVALGDPIIEVVPAAEWIVELEMPEGSIADIRANLTGQLSFNARPEDAQSFAIQRIVPQSKLRGQKQVFIVEGSIDSNAAWLRPGMEGTARIDVDHKPIWWLASHRAVRSIRRLLWI